MIIKNKEINIGIGDKEYRFTNFISDIYLHKYAYASFGGSIVDYDHKVLEICKLKFEGDTEYSVELNSDFLSSIETSKEIASANKITTKYNYYYNGNWEDYVGEKIVEVGFFTEDTENVLAYLDVSNSNIVIQSGQQIIINRIDQISTEAIFYSPFSDITYPSHLSVISGTFQEGLQIRKYASILGSIGLGFKYNEMHTETLYDDIWNIYVDWDYGGEAGKYIFYTFGEDKGDDLFPSPTLYPSEDLYPQPPKYNYLIYKYKLMEYDYIAEEWVDTNKWYYQSVPYEITNEIYVIAKIERGE